jgi:DNA-directed RNA polymerase sigma subunit (sigma70/sigma32)
MITNWQNAQIHEALEEGMVELSEQEHQVMLLHYGWDGYPLQTFAKIGQALGVTR